MEITSTSGRPYAVLTASPTPYQFQVHPMLAIVHGNVVLNAWCRSIRTDGSDPRLGNEGLADYLLMFNDGSNSIRGSIMVPLGFTVASIGPDLPKNCLRAFKTEIVPILRKDGCMFSNEEWLPTFDDVFLKIVSMYAKGFIGSHVLPKKAMTQKEFKAAHDALVAGKTPVHKSEKGNVTSLTFGKGVDKSKEGDAASEPVSADD